MATLHEYYGEILNKYDSQGFKGPLHSTPTMLNQLYPLTDIDSFNTINIADKKLCKYIAYRYFNEAGKKYQRQIADLTENDFEELDGTVKKICEIYVIGLLVKTNLTSNINRLLDANKLTRRTTLTISYRNVNHYLNEIASIINKLSCKQDNTFNATATLNNEQIKALNNHANFITRLYNATLGIIFGKRALRSFG